MSRYFFRPSVDAQTQLSKFYQFLWPTAVALWNLRWQAAGFRSVYPACQESELQSRFVLGSGIHGASIEKACIHSSWVQNQESFAQFLLFQTFSIYESRIAEMLDLLSVKSRDIEKGLQFPSDHTKKKGIHYALSRMLTIKSPILDAAFYTPRTASSPFDSALLERLLIVYRAFKECRNCLAHNGGLCSPEAKQACDNLSAFTMPKDFAVKEIPQMPTQLVGHPIELSLRGCVGFTDIILKIIGTLDLELSRAAKAETVLVNDMLKRTSILNQRKFLKADTRMRAKQVHKILCHLGYPTFNVTEDLCDLLRSKRVISY